jgi:hypothetical protein
MVTLGTYRANVTNKNSAGFSPQVKYIDRAAATCRQIYCQHLQVNFVLTVEYEVFAILRAYGHPNVREPWLIGHAW